MRMLVRHPFGPLLILLLLLGVLVAGCGGDDDSSKQSSDSTSTSSTSDEPAGDSDMPADVADRNDMYDEAPDEPLDADTSYVATVETSVGAFDIELLQDEGPIAAANFAFLAREGFFDGVKVHRIVPGYVIQTGDPLGDGTGGPGYEIQDDEVSVPYERGIVAMANSGPNTGGSQFFVVLEDAPLPPDYAVFGRVDDDGMKVVDEVASTPVGPDPMSGEESVPQEDVIVEHVTLREEESASAPDDGAAPAERTSEPEDRDP